MGVNILRSPYGRKRVFLSFLGDDRQKVNGLRLLNANPDYDLEFYDESVRVAVDSAQADYVKRVIREKIERTSVTVCLLSELTYASPWIRRELEVSTAKQSTIIAMTLKDANVTVVPQLIFSKGLIIYPWHPHHLGRLIQQAP